MGATSMHVRTRRWNPPAREIDPMSAEMDSPGALVPASGGSEPLDASEVLPPPRDSFPPSVPAGRTTSRRILGGREVRAVAR